MSNIKLNRAIDLLRLPDRRLIKQTHNGRTRHFIVPGGDVNDDVAQKIKEHPLVCGERDGLFPDMEQTWRIRGNHD